MIKKTIQYQIQSFLIASCLLLTACSKKKEVSGSVFIVTKGSENIKLGLVDVVVFNRFKFKEKYIDNKKVGLTNDVLSPITKCMSEIRASELGNQYRRDNLKESIEQNPDMSLSSRKIFQKLIDDDEGKTKQLYDKYFKLQQQLVLALIETSTSKQIAKTDADGRFHLQEIGSDDTIVAIANRMVGNAYEMYAWVIKYEDIPQSGQIMLSNNNLVNTGSTRIDLAMGISNLYPKIEANTSK